MYNFYSASAFAALQKLCKYTSHCALGVVLETLYKVSVPRILTSYMLQEEQKTKAILSDAVYRTWVPN